MIRYPLSQNESAENIKSKTGKSIKDITIENILSGTVKAEDIKISKETLLIQGAIAEQEGRVQLKENFIRASELIEVPDKVLLGIYDKLRPYRSTKEDLRQIASELKSKFGAHNCAKLVLEAAEIYEKRGLLKV